MCDIGQNKAKNIDVGASNNEETIPAQGEILAQAPNTEWRVGDKCENSENCGDFLSMLKWRKSVKRMNKKSNMCWTSSMKSSLRCKTCNWTYWTSETPSMPKAQPIAASGLTHSVQIKYILRMPEFEDVERLRIHCSE